MPRRSFAKAGPRYSLLTCPLGGLLVFGWPNFLNQGIHIIDLFEKGPVAYRADGGQTQPADIQVMRFHQRVNPIQPLCQRMIGAFVRAFLKEVNDMNALIQELGPPEYREAA